jgi:hypothetical protein
VATRWTAPPAPAGGGPTTVDRAASTGRGADVESEPPQAASASPTASEATREIFVRAMAASSSSMFRGAGAVGSGATPDEGRGVGRAGFEISSLGLN